MKIPFWLKIVLSILICNSVGIISSSVTLDAIPIWYADLNKPSFNPPNWIFGPAWTILYTLMGISAAAIWESGLNNKKVKLALYAFGMQLALNGIWSFLFFGFKSPLIAFIEILFLILVIIITMNRFKEIKPWTAWLLLPYLLWVVFASLLNLAIYILN